MVMLSTILAITDPVMVAWIGAGQAVVLTVLGWLIKKVNDKANGAKEHSEEVNNQISTNHGKTLGEYVELVSENVELLKSSIDLCNQKLDYIDYKVQNNQEIILEKIEQHEREDKNHFDKLESLLQKNGSRIDILE